MADDHTSELARILAEDPPTETLKPEIQNWWERVKAKARAIDHPDDMAGVDAAARGVANYNHPSRWAPPAAMNAFNLGAMNGIPLLSALLNGRDDDPDYQTAKQEWAMHRTDHPWAYHAGLALGTAPSLLWPKLGIPWAALNVATDPAAQQMARDYFRDRGRKPTTLDPADIAYATPIYRNKLAGDE